MKTKTMSHPDFGNEHQFLEKHYKSVKKGTKRKLISKKVIAYILIINVLGILVLTSLLEWSPFSAVLKKTAWKAVGNIGVFVLTLVLTVFSNIEEIREKSVDLNEAFIYVMRKFMKKATWILVFTAIFWFDFWVADALAEYCFTGRLINGYQEGTEGFKSYDKETVDLFEKNELTAQQNEWLEEQDQELVQEVKNFKVPEGERGVVKNLSNIDKNTIFFLDKITDCETQDAINEVVCTWVRNQKEQQRENKFDKPDDEGGAPDYIEAAISRASENEKDAHYGERKEISEERTNIYEEYPKYSLSNLISNDNHTFALAFYYHGGRSCTIMYYYGQAILYNMDGISYAEVSNSTCKERLTAISQRYRDIAYTCGECEEAEYAEKLAIAFQYAADQY